MKRILFTLCLAFALGGITGGCGRSGSARPTKPDCPAPNTPEQVLESLVTAMQNRDFDTYRKLLDPEYQFRYQPQGVGHWGMPASHGLAEELCAAKELLTDPRVMLTISREPGGPCAE